MASEYLQWKYRDVKPDEKMQYTRKQKLLNWWRYHVWWVLGGVLLLIALGDILLGALGIGIVRPDYQVACVLSAPLSDQAAAGLQATLEALGEDCSGDGRVLVQLNTYADMAASTERDAAGYAAAAQVRLMADMEECESYFFLCSDPEAFQENYQLLAQADGELASPGEPVLALPMESLQPSLGQAEGWEELKGLFLARRGFWQERSCRYRSQCDALWNRLTKELIP